MQIQKPMPMPPVSISAATITSQAIPIDSRTPVNIAGSTAGNRILRITVHSGRFSTRATLR